MNTLLYPSNYQHLLRANKATLKHITYMVWTTFKYCKYLAFKNLPVLFEVCCLRVEDPSPLIVCDIQTPLVIGDS